MWLRLLHLDVHRHGIEHLVGLPAVSRRDGLTLLIHEEGVLHLEGRAFARLLGQIDWPFDTIPAAQEFLWF